jgi:dihydrolipoamide dehydrogenase
LGEREAITRYGEDMVLIGFYRYVDTAKGEAMDAHDYFVKVIVEQGTMKIWSSHNRAVCFYSNPRNHTHNVYQRTKFRPITSSIHIHPA